MIFSKIWLWLVTLAGAVGIALALLAPRPVQKALERETAARLARAQHAASLLLKVNARKWMDTAAQVATDAVLVEALEQATRGPADLGLVHKTVQERLRYFNDRMRVDLVIATDAKGRVIARAGLDEGVYKDGVEGFPLVADALRGWRGDDTWSMGGKLYRVAATPVIARDRYAGALVVGQEVGSELAQSMKQVLDAEVAFLLRGRVLAASVQSPVLERLPVVVIDHAGEIEEAGHSAPLAFDDGQKRWQVMVAPFVGEGAAHKAAYALLLPQAPEPSVGALVEGVVRSDWKQVPWVSLAPVGGALLLAWILGFVFLRLEADRPLRRLAREAQALARGDVGRLDDLAHPGRLGTVARAVNTTLDRLGSRVRRDPVATSDTRATTPMRAAPIDGAPQGPVPPAPLVASPSAPTMMAQVAAPILVPTQPLTTTIPDPEPAKTIEIAPQIAPAFTYEPEATPIVDVAPLAFADAAEGATVARRSPGDVSAPHDVSSPILAPLPSTAVGGPLGVRNFDDETTTMTRKPRPEDTGTHKTEPFARLSPDEEALETELRQVYQDFIDTKHRCGEPTDNVSYEKFVVKLKTNRAQLISRYSCKAVRFQVYIKDGKAALKATPM